MVIGCWGTHHEGPAITPPARRVHVIPTTLSIPPWWIPGPASARSSSVAATWDHSVSPGLAVPGGSSARASPGGQHGMGLPSVGEQLQLVNDYFRHVYPMPPSSFLHEVSVTHRCLTGSLEHSLLRALCSVSALFLGYTKYYPAQTAIWIQEAEGAIWGDIERPTVFKTQALLLIVLVDI